MKKNPIEDKIREFFEENHEMLKLEGGHGLAEDGKETALNQVLLYWRKLKKIAQSVTDTEVKLSLPEQRTPKGKKFTIDGVVDIVKEQGHTWMYDFKTHDPEYIKDNIELYESQINIYAYIWQGLRKNQLDHTAIISTAYPDVIKQALLEGDEAKLDHALDKWDPLIDIPFDETKVKGTIQDFAKVVDCIEEDKFEPVPLKGLKELVKGTGEIFAVRICRNCDARFSCTSYVEYAQASTGGGLSGFKKYYSDYGPELDQEEWVDTNLEAGEGRIG